MQHEVAKTLDELFLSIMDDDDKIFSDEIVRMLWSKELEIMFDIGEGLQTLSKNFDNNEGKSSGK